VWDGSSHTRSFRAPRSSENRVLRVPAAINSLEPRREDDARQRRKGILPRHVYSAFLAAGRRFQLPATVETGPTAAPSTHTVLAWDILNCLPSQPTHLITARKEFKYLGSRLSGDRGHPDATDSPRRKGGRLLRLQLPVSCGWKGKGPSPAGQSDRISGPDSLVQAPLSGQSLAGIPSHLGTGASAALCAGVKCLSPVGCSRSDSSREEGKAREGQMLAYAYSPIRRQAEYPKASLFACFRTPVARVCPKKVHYLSRRLQICCPHLSVRDRGSPETTALDRDEHPSKNRCSDRASDHSGGHSESCRSEFKGAAGLRL